MPRTKRNPRDSVRHARLVGSAARIIMERLREIVDRQEGSVWKPSRSQAYSTLEHWVWIFWESVNPDFRKWEFCQIFIEALDMLEEVGEVELLYDPCGIITGVRLPKQRPRDRRSRPRKRQIHLAVIVMGPPKALDRYELALSQLVRGEDPETALRAIEVVLAEEKFEILDVLPRTSAFRSLRK